MDLGRPDSEARILERGKTSGRADDNAEAIRKRLATFKEEAKPSTANIEAFHVYVRS